MHRAVLEGVGFAVNRHLQVLERATGTRPEMLIASGGGAKADLWLQIKAAIYDRPILIPEEAECGLVGCATLASVATGESSNLSDASMRTVRHAREVHPNPDWPSITQRCSPYLIEFTPAASSFTMTSIRWMRRQQRTANDNLLS